VALSPTLLATLRGRETSWGTLWATEPTDESKAHDLTSSKSCKSEWARLGSNERPLACEASDQVAFSLLIGAIW
jgi:hypothetical protein